MTDAERDELLIRMDERMKSIDEKLAADYKHLHGNGQPGLIERVKELEDWKDAKQKHVGAIAGVIGFVINAVIAWYAALKK